MIPLTLTFRGMSSAFPGDVSIDFQSIRRRSVVGVVGGNGEGKTTTIELMAPAPLYRKLPSRGERSTGGVDPVTYAVGRDSFIELTYDCGPSGIFRSRLNLDGHTGNTDAVIARVNADGSTTPMNRGGQVTTYRQVIENLFPSLKLFLASAFAAQGRGDEFTAASASARKDLCIEFLGLERLEEMSKLAGEAIVLCDSARARLQASVDVLKRETASSHFDVLDSLERDYDARVPDLQSRLVLANTAIEDLEHRVVCSTDSTAAAAAATLRINQIQPELTARTGELERVRRDRSTAVDDAKAETSAIGAKRTATVTALEAKIRGNERVLENADRIRSAVASFARLDEDLRVLRDTQASEQTQRTTVATDLAAAEKAVSSFAVPKQERDRAVRDSALLKDVPCGGAGEYARCQLLTEAVAAAARVPALEAKLAGVADAIRQRDDLVVERDRLDGRLKTRAATIAETERVKADHAKDADYAVDLGQAEARVAEYRGQIEQATLAAETALEALRVRLASRVADCDEREQRLRESIDRLTRDLDAAKADLADAQAGNDAVRRLRDELTAARSKRDVLTTELAKIDSGREELARRRGELEAKTDALTAQRDRLRQVVDHRLEWEFFKKALGKGGLIDLELDAAGPKLTDLTNALLCATYGPRFTVQFVTQVPNADGTGVRDKFTVLVLDSESVIGDGWRDVRELSGGQRVIVQEALMLAISIYVNEQFDLPIRTLWRDETGAALDAEHAVRYVQMLRKALEIGQFEYVFIVSHNPEVNRRVDAQLYCGEGRVRVLEPPFDVEAA